MSSNTRPAPGNTLAPLVAATLLGRVGFRKELDRLRDAIAILFLAALVAMLISATIGAGTLVLSGAIPPHGFLPAGTVWWTGDAMGVLVVAPFLLSLFLPRDRAKASWGRRAEAIGLFIALTLLSLGITEAGLRLFIVFPLLGWAAWRFQQRACDGPGDHHAVESDHDHSASGYCLGDPVIAARILSQSSAAHHRQS